MLIGSMTIDPHTIQSVYLTLSCLDVLALTETWLCNGDDIILNELLPPGYDIQHVDRGRRGGGVSLWF